MRINFLTASKKRREKKRDDDWLRDPFGISMGSVNVAKQRRESAV